MKGRPWAWALGFCNCGKSSDSRTVGPALQPWTNLQLSHVLAMMFLSQSDSESWGLRTVHVHPGEGSSPTTKEHLSIVCEVGCPIQGFTSQQQTEPNKTRGYFVHVLDRYNSPLLLFAKNRGFPWHRTCCLKKKSGKVPGKPRLAGYSTKTKVSCIVVCLQQQQQQKCRQCLA